MPRRKRRLRVAIIGAGISGVCTAALLKRAGFDFTVFEQAAGPGGTWWDNTYPGCEVDGRSILYSFTFMPYDWSGTHAPQRELQQYTEDIIDRFGMRGRFQFSTKVEEAVWDDERCLYRIRLANGEDHEFEALVSALGILNVPKHPDWPGLEEFAGERFHSARWRHDLLLTGKSVAFVGTGSTGAQVVPKLAEIVGDLYVYQRQPGWILPKGERAFTEEERERFHGSPTVERRWRRYRAYRLQKKLVVGTSNVNAKLHKQVQQTALDFIESQIEDPEIRRAVTPDYPLGCKRIVLASTFYQALNRDNVTLVPHAVKRVTREGIISADGVERKVDVLITGTGFHPTEFLNTLDVRGRGGRSIHQFWSGDPRAFVGITVPGFPNFFMCYGPNTNGGPGIMFMAEKQAQAIVRILRRLERSGARAIDTRPAALDRYVRWLDEANRTHMSARYTGCTNYDFAASGRAVLLWPRSGAYYGAMARWLPIVGMTVLR
jgi:cation diffusion facilitator CzcD-associated flavoprotein CzcO